MSSQNYLIRLKLPQSYRGQSREEFLALLWTELSHLGLAGVHEGTLLSEEAYQSGLEVDSWVLDSAQAPRSRDWVSLQDVVECEFYFTDKNNTQAAFEKLQKLCPDLNVGAPEPIADQDWNEEWKKSFKGVEVEPDWMILPPWEDVRVDKKNLKIIKINPGSGFGTGTHETTQLCLKAISFVQKEQSQDLWSALDFGSGSGILSLSLALSGAKVCGVEIDPLAIDNAEENLLLNPWISKDRVSFSQNLPDSNNQFNVVVANILRPVLVAFAQQLVARIKKPEKSHPSFLILSGLIQNDLDEVLKTYGAFLGPPLKILEKGEWRCLIWKKEASPPSRQ